jgi:2'-5' RNA ligase
MRLFVAVDVPPPEVPGLGPWMGAPAHVTLKFLGEVPPEALPPLAPALERALRGASAFPVTLRGLGAFPSAQRPRILWTGFEVGAREIADLARRVDEGLSPLGFPSEERPFHPHVTLRRIRNPSEAVWARKLLDRHPTTLFARGQVREVHLKKSELRPEGALHTSLLAVPLTPQSA